MRRIHSVAAAVNSREQTVALRGVEHSVEPDKTRFSRIKPGDQVRAIYTEAAAVAMETARRK